MNIEAAEKAIKWLLQAGIMQFKMERIAYSFEFTFDRPDDAARLHEYLREQAHVVEVFGGAKWRVF